MAGGPADRGPVAAGGDAAERLGRFLRALHAAAPPDAPRNAHRSVALADRAASFERYAARLAGDLDTGALRRVWAAACAAPGPTGPAVWVHGDLHPANVLVVAGTVAAVVDWGDLCAGDRATDLASAWLLLPAQAHDRFADAYGRVDDATEARARGWAALFALLLAGAGERATYRAVARATADRLRTTTG